MDGARVKTKIPDRLIDNLEASGKGRCLRLWGAVWLFAGFFVYNLRLTFNSYRMYFLNNIVISKHLILVIKHAAM